MAFCRLGTIWRGVPKQEVSTSSVALRPISPISTRPDVSVPRSAPKVLAPHRGGADREAGWTRGVDNGDRLDLRRRSGPPTRLSRLRESVPDFLSGPSDDSHSRHAARIGHDNQVMERLLSRVRPTWVELRRTVTTTVSMAASETASGGREKDDEWTRRARRRDRGFA
jgi:hypothetical protein